MTWVESRLNGTHTISSKIYLFIITTSYLCFQTIYGSMFVLCLCISMETEYSIDFISNNKNGEIYSLLFVKWQQFSFIFIKLLQQGSENVTKVKRRTSIHLSDPFPETIGIWLSTGKKENHMHFTLFFH